MRPLYLLVLMIAAAPALAAGTLERIRANGHVKLGYGTDARPFSFQDSGGKPIGYGVELCARVAGALKAEPRFVHVKREEGPRAVAEGGIDLLCDLVSGRPSKTGQAYTFALIAGSRAEPLAIERLRASKIEVKTLAVKDYNAGIDAVTVQRADAFFADRAVLLDTVRRGPRAKELRLLERYFTHDALAFALARGDEDFRLAVDDALSRLFRSEEIRALYTKWFGEPSEETLSLFRLGALRE